jgi:hypothetical protein
LFNIGAHRKIEPPGTPLIFHLKVGFWVYASLSTRFFKTLVDNPEISEKTSIEGRLRSFELVNCDTNHSPQKCVAAGKRRSNAPEEVTAKSKLSIGRTIRHENILLHGGLHDGCATGPLPSGDLGDQIVELQHDIQHLRGFENLRHTPVNAVGQN